MLNNEVGSGRAGVATVPSPVRVYVRLLGERAAELHPAVRELHCTAGGGPAAGWFVVTRGGGRVARALGWALRLPRAGLVPVRLEVDARGDAERWRRFVGHRVLRSEQRLGNDGLLVERYGALEQRFAVDAIDGALIFRQVSAAVPIGPIRVPLPPRLGPSVSASARAASDGAVAVSVRVSAAGCRPLLAYSGHLTCPVGRDGG